MLITKPKQTIYLGLNKKTEQIENTSFDTFEVKALSEAPNKGLYFCYLSLTNSELLDLEKHLSKCHGKDLTEEEAKKALDNLKEIAKDRLLEIGGSPLNLTIDNFELHLSYYIIKALIDSSILTIDDELFLG